MNKLLSRKTKTYHSAKSVPEELVRYTFQFRTDAPYGLKTDFLIGLSKDNISDGNVLEIALQLNEIIQDYWIHSDKDNIKKVVEYLELYQYQDEHDALIEEKNSLQARLAIIEEELAALAN